MSIMAQEIPKRVDFESLPTVISVNVNNNLVWKSFRDGVFIG